MINTSDKIIVISKDDLDSAIRKSLFSVLAHLESRYGKVPDRVLWDSPNIFRQLFSEAKLRAGANFDAEFLQRALQFSLTNSRNQGVSEFLNSLPTYTDCSAPAASAIGSLKQGIKLLLVELWHKQVIILPTVFSGGPFFDPVPISNDLYKFIRSFEPKEKEQRKSASGVGGNARRMYFYMPRILWATTWGVVEDVSIYELADLHRSQLLYLSGKSSCPSISSEAVPWSLFLTELYRAFPDRVRYSLDQLKHYSQWLNSRRATDNPFSEFIPHAKRKISKKAPRAKPDPRLGNQKEVFEQLGGQNSHDATLEYFTKLVGKPRGGFDWLESEPTYPGREHVEHGNKAKLWRESFLAFIHHRQSVMGYETDKSVVTSLNLLADYLFLYLPWWKELFSESKIELPDSPKSFGRYTFVYRSSPELIEHFPVTILEIVKLRRISDDSQYQVIKYLQKYFQFVEQNFADDERIAGEHFKCPIYGEFDLPRVKKRTKTSKVVFPKNANGYLIYYGYAVEAFGEFLQDKCLEREFSQPEIGELQRSRWLSTERYGFVPIVRYRGKLTPLFTIPNVFTWASRTIKQVDLHSEERFIPHLTVLRLLVLAIEVGLRLMGLRWLDRRTWDSKNVEAPDISRFSFYPTDKYVYGLNVSTDKTKNEAWDTSMVFRVRSMMLREQKFQLSIDESMIDLEVPYANREHSRFGRILPLFRSAKSPEPILEATYHKYWLSFITGFQEFYGVVNGSKTQFVKIVPRGEIVQVKVDTESGAQYCPVSILAINTPHACRATFATNRQGILETSDIADLLGHNSVEVTAYYQAPRAEDLNKKLEDSDRALFEDYRIFDHGNASYIRPDKQGSSLVRSFSNNREETLQHFGFMPTVSLWSTDDSDKLDDDGLKILRDGPMSLIRFRETHICPVGEECPSDVIKSTGGFKRCGICPLAVKCIDHLPGIAAKKNALVERIQYLTKQRERLEASGENAAADALWDEVDLETNELMGWQLSEEILAKIYHESILKSNSDSEETVYHVERPDIVRRHLQRIVRKTRQTDFLLHRIAESNAFPSLQTPQIQAIAANIRRKLLAGKSLPDFVSDVPGPDEVKVTAALLKTVMKANELSIEDMSNRLMDNIVTLPGVMPFKLEGNSNEG